MNVGSKYIFYIPSELAYGPNPRPGGPIQPNDLLIFEVELIEIVSPEPN
jgi:FKBP-type peptidyl-prolyl cis-trans isomerase